MKEEITPEQAKKSAEWLMNVLIPASLESQAKQFATLCEQYREGKTDVAAVLAFCAQEYHESTARVFARLHDLLEKL